jgi:hypothetical protein
MRARPRHRYLKPISDIYPVFLMMSWWHVANTALGISRPRPPSQFVMTWGWMMGSRPFAPRFIYSHNFMCMVHRRCARGGAGNLWTGIACAVCINIADDYYSMFLLLNIMRWEHYWSAVRFEPPYILRLPCRSQRPLPPIAF